MGDDPLKVIRQIAEAGLRVRLSPGVVGKASMMYLAVVLVWAIMFARMSPDHPIFDAVLVGAGIVLLLITTRENRKMREFASANPALALLEGAELLKYMKSEARTKELPRGDVSPPIEGPKNAPDAIKPEDQS